MKKLVLIISLVIIAFAAFWFFYPLRSYVVMGFYSASHAKESVMKQNGFEIDIPSGSGWYPFVLTYNAQGFSKFSGTDADMSILYNFGAFDLCTRTSALYDETSSKYSSFYGAYVIKQNDNGLFGFDENGAADMSEISLAVKYDYTKLVIEDFGCEIQTFEINDYTIEENDAFAGTDGWTKIDAVLTVNGAAHNYDRYKPPYLQYGRPMKKAEEDFGLIKLCGRVYAKYLSEYGCTVLVYVTAPDIEEVNACCEDILSKTIIVPQS